MNISASTFKMNLFSRYKVDKKFVLATHVFTNVAHFRKLLIEFPWNSQPTWIRWGLIEATLVKARAIADFLITDSHHHKDDFGAQSMVSTWIQPESEFFALREVVNKQVVHFAQQRFIGERGNDEVLSIHLISELRLVDLAFLRFEKELKKIEPDLYRELTKQILIF